MKIVSYVMIILIYVIDALVKKNKLYNFYKIIILIQDGYYLTTLKICKNCI